MQNDNTPPINPKEIVLESKQPYTSPLIELFEIDLTSVGVGILGITNSYNEDGSPLLYNGRQYFSMPVKIDDIEYKGDGSIAITTLTLSTMNAVTASMIINNDNLVGCTVTRIKTFEKFLDNGSEPDPASRFQNEIYKINRRKTLNQYTAQFELTNIGDVENKFLPRNQVIKTYCPYIYRRYIGGKFVIDKHYPCPYMANAYFDEDNKPCEASKDKCSKQVEGCQARYGDSVLPFQGFPSIPKG